MKRKRRPYAVYAISRDLLARIRRAEWAQERKEAAGKELREPQRPQFAESWRQITQVMGPS